MPLRTVLTLTIALALARAAAGAPIYVDCNAPGPTHNGASWATAYKTIAQALNSTTSNEIWVKTGVYRENVILKKYTNIYGGFLGCEGSTADRLPGAFPTVIDAGKRSRAIDTLASGFNTIDGFTIRHGLADRGGGIRCSSYTALKIRNCRVVGCKALLGAGGVYLDIYTTGEMSDTYVLDCEAPEGGGVIVEYHASPVLRRCVIAGNHATGNGGGVNCPFHSGALLENCTVSFNSADVTGGGIWASYGGPETFNYCVVTNNSAPVGGGIYGAGGSTQATISHCDFYANAGGDWGGAISEPAPTYMNIHADPMFIAPESGEYHLYSNSLCTGMGAFPPEGVYKLERIGVARYLPDGATARFTGKAVAFVDGGVTYVEETDRGGAIAVYGLSGLARGDVLSWVEGTLSTDANGRRILQGATCSRWTCGQYVPKPLGTPISRLAGTAGAYVRTWGRVESLLPNGLRLRDGDASVDVRISGASAQAGDCVAVSGVYTINLDFAADSLIGY